MYTDEKILQILQLNREKGAKLLMEKYSPLIRSTCARKLHNQEDINECVNDVFAEFCMNIERYDGDRSNLKNYLCTIAERRAVDKFRKNCRNEKMEQEVLRKYKEDEISKEHLAKRKEQLEDAMEQLPELDKQILEMHYYEGRSYGEIAEELDMKYENVRKRGLRGRKKLLYFILLGILILVITACTTVVMKKHDLLPKWFPFYDWILPDETEEEESKGNGVKDKIQLSVGEEWKKDGKEEENETELQEILKTESENNTESKKYQFVNRYGFVWSEEATYSLSSSSPGFEKDGVRFEMAGAMYSNGKLTVNVRVIPLDGHYFEVQADEYDFSAYLLLENGQKIPLNFGGHNISKENARLEYIYKYQADWTLEDEDQDTIYCTIVVDDTVTFEVELSKLEVQEQTESEKNSFGDIQLELGPAQTDGNIAIVSLTQNQIEEYKISNLIASSYYGLPGKEVQFPYLTDDEGNTYSLMRTSAKDYESEGVISRVFEIYYRKVEAGEYTLHIPYLCLEKEDETESVTINLPSGEDAYLACDEKILFPDGSGFHITGLTRSEYEEEIYNVDKDGNLTIDTTHYWYYEMEYETLSSEAAFDGALQFYNARARGSAQAAGCESGEQNVSLLYKNVNGTGSRLYIGIKSDEINKNRKKIMVKHSLLFCEKAVKKFPAMSRNKDFVRIHEHKGEKNMLKIILCEDDITYRENLRQAISRILFDKEEVSFECFNDGYELVQVLERGEQLWADLIFMDITMPKLDGMKTARILRRNNVDSALIFVTERKDMVFQGYAVHAFAYLLKSMVKEKLEEVVLDYLEERARSKKQYLLMKKHKRIERIPVKAIRYLVSDKRKLKAVMEALYETTEFYMQMSEAEKYLEDAGFVRCHQSYLVNAHHILYWDGINIVLPGNEKIPVSRRYRKKVNQRFEELTEK